MGGKRRQEEQEEEERVAKKRRDDAALAARRAEMLRRLEPALQVNEVVPEPAVPKWQAPEPAVPKWQAPPPPRAMPTVVAPSEQKLNVAGFPTAGPVPSGLPATGFPTGCPSTGDGPAPNPDPRVRSLPSAVLAAVLRVVF